MQRDRQRARIAPEHRLGAVAVMGVPSPRRRCAPARRRPAYTGRRWRRCCRCRSPWPRPARHDGRAAGAGNRALSTAPARMASTAATPAPAARRAMLSPSAPTRVAAKRRGDIAAAGRADCRNTVEMRLCVHPQQVGVAGRHRREHDQRAGQAAGVEQVFDPPFARRAFRRLDRLHPVEPADRPEAGAGVVPHEALVPDQAGRHRRLPCRRFVRRFVRRPGSQTWILKGAVSNALRRLSAPQPPGRQCRAVPPSRAACPRRCWARPAAGWRGWRSRNRCRPGPAPARRYRHRRRGAGRPVFGCSTWLVLVSITPGARILSSGIASPARSSCWWPCWGLAPSNRTTAGFARKTISAISANGTSWVCGPG